MAKNKITVGIIGLGNIGFKYDLKLKLNQYVYTHFRAFNKNKYFKINFCVDVNQKTLNEFSKYSKIPFYKNINKIKKYHFDTDIIVLSTPTNKMLETFNDILKNLKIKILLIEKPFAINVKDASKIISLAKKNNIKLFINYNLISDISYLEIKNKIKRRQLGNLLTGTVYYTKGIYTNGSHFINLLINLFGNITNIERITNPIKYKNDYLCNFIIFFKNNKIFFQYIDERFYSHYGVNLFFQNGYLEYSNSTMNISWQKISEKKIRKDYNYLTPKKEIIKNNFNLLQLNVVNNIENYLKNKKYSLVNETTSFQTIQCIQKIIN